MNNCNEGGKCNGNLVLNFSMFQTYKGVYQNDDKSGIYVNCVRCIIGDNIAYGNDKQHGNMPAPKTDDASEQTKHRCPCDSNFITAVDFQAY